MITLFVKNWQLFHDRSYNQTGMVKNNNRPAMAAAVVL
jgi:hypothetical protein